MQPLTAPLPAVARAAHLGPSLVVTAIAAALTASAGASGDVVALVIAAVLTGQLTVGWTNDLHDMSDDVASARSDKPLATGEVTSRLVRLAVTTAAVACLLFSAALGPTPGTVHLVGVVGSGLVYDLFLKPTRWSWVPFAVAFGLLPAVATLAADERWPPAWLMAGGAMLGVAAHLANSLPDLDADAQQGVRGLPHRLGAARSRALAVGLLVATTALLVLTPGEPGHRFGGYAVVVLAVSIVLAAAALVVPWPRQSRAPFVLVAVLALSDVALLVARH